MKKLSVIAAVVFLIGMLLTTDAQAGRARNRMTQQQARIGQGVRSGALTGPEIGRLEREQAAIRRDTRRSLADGVLTPPERHRLEREQDRASRHIYRLKHNEAAR